MSKITTITRKRAATILPQHINKSFFIYNGKESIRLIVNNNHIGKKLGIFSITKKIGKSIHDSARNRKKKNKNKKK